MNFDLLNEVKPVDELCPTHNKKLSKLKKLPPTQVLQDCGVLGLI